jgi:hypothetical protein
VSLFGMLMTIRPLPVIVLNRAIAGSGKVQRGDLKRSVLSRFRSPSQIRVLRPTLSEPEQHSERYEGALDYMQEAPALARNLVELRCESTTPVSRGSTE